MVLKNSRSDSEFLQTKSAWTNVFTTFLFLYALYILATFLLARFFPRFPGIGRALPRGPGGGGGGFWPRGGGFWPGGGGNNPAPGAPPPYSKTSTPEETAWRPGFWTGLAAGAAALQGANYMRQRPVNQGFGGRTGMGGYHDDDDRGVGSSGTRWGSGGGGSSGGGSMRTTSGFGGTRNR